MLQDTSDLDFDAYFNVPSAQRQSKRNADILYHSSATDMSPNTSPRSPALNATSPLLSAENRLSSASTSRHPPNNAPNPIFSEPNKFDTMLAWDFEHASPSQSQSVKKVVSSPNSSASLSPQFPVSSNSRMNFAKNETSHTYTMPTIAPIAFGLNQITLGGNMPGITIPATPRTVTNFASSNIKHASLSLSGSSQCSSHLSPLMDSNTFSSAFTPIDRGWNIPVNNPDQGGNSAVRNNEHDTRNWRKRNNGAIGDFSHIMEPSRQLKKVAHNAIERRYRNNINNRIQELKNAVPALYKSKVKDKRQQDDHGDEASDSDISDEECIVDGVQIAKKLNKATILRKATEYILFLKHKNMMASRENQILQHIVVQMPGGNQILSRYLAQKQEFEKAEQERMMQERRKKQEEEQAERQRVLRERAAQRNALAQITGKPQRQPYRRRKKAPPQNKAQKENEHGAKMYMAIMTCLVLSSPSMSSFPGRTGTAGESRAFASSSTYLTELQVHHDSNSLALRHLLQILVLLGFFLLVFLYPIIRKQFYSSLPSTGRKCTDSSHHHYAPDVATAWAGLYSSLFEIAPLNPAARPFRLILAMVFDVFSLCLIWRPKSLVKSDELAVSGAWVRMSEIECLGGNPMVTRFQMLRSCTGMLAAIQKLKRDKRHRIFFNGRTRARIYATAAIQLELVLPVLGDKFSRMCWRRVAEAIQSDNDKKDHWFFRAKDTGMEHWPTSKGHRQIMAIVRARNGFDANPNNCRHIFYSFVLPYLTSPLDWVLYWHALHQFQDMWTAYIDALALEHGKQHSIIFSLSQLPPSVLTPIDQMLSWWIHLGIYLESLETSLARSSLYYLKEHAIITDNKSSRFQPSSVLLQSHCAMVYHIAEAMAVTQAEGVKSARVAVHHLEIAAQKQTESTECIRQIALLPSSNDEATVFLLSTVAVHLQALHTFSRQLQVLQMPTQQRQPIENAFGTVGFLMARSLCQLRDQLSQDMATLMNSNVTAGLLSHKCRRKIKAYITKVDDALSI